MNSTETALISAASSVVNRMPPQADILNNTDAGELYRLAAAHQMTAVAAEAFHLAGIRNDRFSTERIKSVSTAFQYDVERKRILNQLEKAQIWYLPLKGIILQEYYPHPGLRQMCDNDILFDASRAADVRSIMESCGYETIRFGKLHQDDYQKEPFLHFEMHRKLFSALSDERLPDYYRNAEQFLKGSGFRKVLTDEDFYIYMIAHEYRHYTREGTGLRSLLDTYVYLKKCMEILDWNYIHTEVRKLGMEDFEKKNRSLSLKVFSEGKTDSLTAAEKSFLQSFVSFGAYGTYQHKIENQVAEQGIRRYMMRRVFLSMSEIEQIYPFYFRHKALLPVLPLVRLCRRRKNAGKEIRTLLNLSDP